MGKVHDNNYQLVKIITKMVKNIISILSNNNYPNDLNHHDIDIFLVECAVE